MIELWRKPEKLGLEGLTFPDVQWKDEPVLLIYGSAGSGKTQLGKWYADLWSIGSYEWPYICAVDLIECFRNHCKTSLAIGVHLKRVYSEPRLVIDDLCEETPEKFNKFKTEYNPVEIFRKIIYVRHSMRLRTIILSNQRAEKIAEYYDRSDKKRGRIHSRLSDSAKIWFFKGDRRKGEKFEFSPRTMEGITEQQMIKSDVPIMPEMQKVEKGIDSISQAEIDKQIRLSERFPFLKKGTEEWLRSLSKNKVEIKKSKRKAVKK